MQDVRPVLLYGSTFPCRDVTEGRLKKTYSGHREVGIHWELRDVDRPPAYAAGLVPAVLPARADAGVDVRAR